MLKNKTLTKLKVSLETFKALSLKDKISTAISFVFIFLFVFWLIYEACFEIVNGGPTVLELWNKITNPHTAQEKAIAEIIIIGLAIIAGIVVLCILAFLAIMVIGIIFWIFEKIQNHPILLLCFSALLSLAVGFEAGPFTGIGFFFFSTIFTKILGKLDLYK